MKIGIFGATGKMGRMLVTTAEKIAGVQIVAACDSETSLHLGQDVGEVAKVGHLNVPITADVAALFRETDVALDFSFHTASAVHARIAAESRKPLVIGTTGFTDDELEIIRAAATITPIVLAPNMSVGINILLSFVERAARMLDSDYDIEVLEMHHRAKIDAPSGTALVLGRAAAKGRGIELEEAMRASRVGNVGKRMEGEIGFATLRGGDVAGDHTVIFAAEGERVEFAHKASSREVFALGAYRAAKWIVDKPAGLYSMQDVLGLTK